jgi:hypothetical protein
MKIELIETKCCNKCDLEKPLTEFKKLKKGFKSFCVLCEKQYMKIYRENNKEKLKKQKQEWYINNLDYNKNIRKEYYLTNTDKIKTKVKNYAIINKEKIKQRNKINYIENKDKIIKQHNEYIKQRKKIDPLFKLKINIRNNIYNNLKRCNVIKNKKTDVILGCTYEEFKQHLETQFESWMNWDNYGLYNGTLNYGWDIDHIIPTSSAVTEEELLKLNHYTNLKPLCGKINRDIKKGSI